MKILIVDDDKRRAEEIRSLFTTNVNVNDANIIIADNVNEALSIIKRAYYDILILDVILPKRSGETANHLNGINLLTEISERRDIKKPEKIVGITANAEDIGKYSEKFQNYCLSVIEAKRTSNKWQESLVNAVRYTFESKEIRLPQDSSIVVTVHGIRTFGKWQERLKIIASQHYDNLNFYNYKYGFFTSVLFFFPHFRNYEVKKFEDKLKSLITKNKGKKIRIFCHSFGTDIVVRAVENIMKDQGFIPIETLVLSGSILSSNHDWSLIMESSEAKIINECGTSDYILWLSNMFVPLSGMAGRIGFWGFNNSRQVNRYHKGGHSLYFNDDNFILNYWIPLFRRSELEYQHIDERVNNFIIDSILEPIVLFLGNIKSIVYIAFFILLLVYITTLIFVS